MDPATTLPEVARLLRRGGGFAAFDAVWPPAVHWVAEAAWWELHAIADPTGASSPFGEPRASGPSDDGRSPAGSR